MNIKDFYKLLIEDKINIQHNSHTFDKEHFIYKIKNEIEFNEEMCKAHKDDKFYEFYYNSLNRNIELFEPINIGFTSDINCYYCGEPLVMIYVGNNDVAIINSSILYSKTKKEIVLSEHINQECNTQSLVKQKYLETNINVKDGELIFVNFFRPDELSDFIEKERYKTKNNICYINGRNNLMQHLSKNDVGYCQTGNMSLGIYISEDKKTILIATPYDDELEYDDLNGYNLIGKICCDMWRWQCADISTLKKYYENWDEYFEENDEYPVENYTSVEVPKGKWNIKHFYDFMPYEEFSKGKPMSILTFIE